MSKKIKVKPGKTQSKIGFIAGILFVFIGIFVVIPTFGVFGIVWTAFAGLIAWSNYRNGFTEKGVPTHVVEIDDEEGTVYNRAGFATERFTVENDENIGNLVESRLKSLQSLYEQGLITKEEYEDKKQEILKDL